VFEYSLCASFVKQCKIYGYYLGYGYPIGRFTSEILRNIMLKFGIPGFPKIYGLCLIFVLAGHYDFSLIFGENHGLFIFYESAHIS
jgi:hypothetical protein